MSTVNGEGSGGIQPGLARWHERQPFSTYEEFPRGALEGSIPERFEEIVERHADRIAIQSDTVRYTYAEFNREVNRLANRILQSEISEGTPVGFLLSDVVMQVRCAYAILKTGMAYLPLDPTFPLPRISYMFRDSQAELLITDSANLEMARELAGPDVELLNIDNLDPDLSVDNPKVTIEPDSLANLLYTSGSSGEPKGVMQTHRNLLHSVLNNTNLERICLEDRVAMLVSVSFAASVIPVHCSLLNGAAVLVFDMKHGLAYLTDWLREERVTHLFAVPTLFRHLMQPLSDEVQFPDMRVVLMGGEAMLQFDFDLFKKHFPDNCGLINLLAGTEMLVIRTYFLDKETRLEDNVIPAGYPVIDKEILLLDEDGEPVPIGEVGEIVIKSEYLALGYWRQPEKTHEKFEDNPEGGRVRLYHTGDLGKMAPDGCLYHMGRKDFQIKLRGFRIELGEIESLLMQHPAVKEALAIIDERDGQEKRLLAYVVFKNREIIPSTEELRQYLAERLPDYMVPFAFITLDAMPLTPTGKLNRLALPPLEQALNLEQDYVAPRDETEKKLAELWEEAFKIHPIGIRNDFFKLGGHSLTAASLIARVEEEFGQRIHLTTFTDATTIERQAEILRDKNYTGPEHSLVAIQPKGTRPPLFFVHGVGGHVIPFRKLSVYLGDEQPVYGLQSKGLDGRGEQPDSIEAMAAAYIEEIKAVQGQGPYYLGGFSFGGFVIYEMARQLEERGEAVGLLAIFDTQAGAAPLFRQSLTRSKYIHYRGQFLAEKMKYHVSSMMQRPPHRMLTYVFDRERRPSEREVILGEDYDDYFVPEYLEGVMQANARALLNYLPGLYGGSLALFKSIDHGKGVYYGWEELVQGAVEVFEVPGNHRGIFEEPNIQVLARHLKGCMERALQFEY